MTDDDRTRPGGLPLEIADRLDRTCDRFDAAWSAGARPRIEDYLGEVPAPALGDLLRELVAADLEHRERNGEQPAVADYLGRFPEHQETILDEFGRRGGLESGSPAAVVADSSTPAIVGYEVFEELGRGGMGVVYKARQVRLNRIVALKMILAGVHASPEAVTRFLNEAEVIARLRHPNIVQIHAIGDHERRPYIELEFVGGGTLAEALDGTPWPSLRAAGFIEVLARAVHEAHRQGVVHRDLKPANVLLGDGGVPKIADFGLAKLASLDSGLTRTDSVLGSPSYMAPEQAEGRARESGTAADVYSLGAIFYELLTGRPPFKAPTVLMTLEQVRSADPVPPSWLQPGLARDAETICLKCLAKSQAGRYPTAEALANDLRAFAEGRRIWARDSHIVERLIAVLRRGQHDREFRTWGNVFLILIPLFTTPHLFVFALALTAPETTRDALSVTWLVILALLGFLFAINRSRLRLPSSPVVRNYASLLVGGVIASTLMPMIARNLGMTPRPQDDLKLYPFYALMSGVLYFSLGGGYWGGCYLAAAAFFLAALLMPLQLTCAPLAFAIISALAFLAIGLHLRRLGREEAHDPVAAMTATTRAQEPRTAT